LINKQPINKNLKIIEIKLVVNKKKWMSNYNNNITIKIIFCIDKTNNNNNNYYYYIVT